MIRPEYPDPLLEHADWLSLNGPWEFVETRGRWFGRPAQPETLTVPFCVEAAASGVGRRLRGDSFWLRRRVTAPAAWRGKKIYLRAGAVDYRCEGFVNGLPAGVHEGGYTPMAWRIDPLLRPGENEISLFVRETRRGDLPRGKQTHLPFPYAVFYAPTSGVWQPVWLEARGQTNLAQAHAVADDDDVLHFHLRFDGPPAGEIEIRLTHPDGAPDAVVVAPIAGDTMTLAVRPLRPARWSPDAPQLYQTAFAVRQNGAVVDAARGYAGLRTIRVAGGRVLLNGEPLYHKFALYQAYYPEGWASPLADDVFRSDVETLKAFGFNGLRLHQTLADPRLLYWCDKLGLLAWAEMPSPFAFAKVNRPAFEAMLREALARDRGHPAIAAWVLFNETWGIYDILRDADARAWVRRMTALARELDPSRPVVDNSGFAHLDSDILDIHHYLKGPERIRRLYRRLADPTAMGYQHWRNLYIVLAARIYESPLAPTGRHDGRPIVISECGGHGFKYYGDSSMSKLDSFRQTVSLLAEYPYLQGFAYTQFCDVGQEQNGLVSFDRRPKIDPAEVRALLAPLGKTKQD
jgi:beta-galactosidase/beta-glucuronidase